MQSTLVCVSSKNRRHLLWEHQKNEAPRKKRKSTTTDLTKKKEHPIVSVFIHHVILMINFRIHLSYFVRYLISTQMTRWRERKNGRDFRYIGRGIDFISHFFANRKLKRMKHSWKTRWSNVPDTNKRQPKSTQWKHNSNKKTKKKS